MLIRAISESQIRLVPDALASDQTGFGPICKHSEVGAPSESDGDGGEPLLLGRRGRRRIRLGTQVVEDLVEERCLRRLDDRLGSGLADARVEHQLIVDADTDTEFHGRKLPWAFAHALREDRPLRHRRRSSLQEGRQSGPLLRERPVLDAEDGATSLSIDGDRESVRVRVRPARQFEAIEDLDDNDRAFGGSDPSGQVLDAIELLVGVLVALLERGDDRMTPEDFASEDVLARWIEHPPRFVEATGDEAVDEGEGELLLGGGVVHLRRFAPTVRKPARDRRSRFRISLLETRGRRTSTRPRERDDQEVRQAAPREALLPLLRVRRRTETTTDRRRRVCSEARRYHEDAEGYDVGEADAERIAALPDKLHVNDGWRDGPKGKVHEQAGWPSDELLVACGGEIAEQPRGGLRDTMGVVCKDVRFGSRVFRAGDVVTNMDRAHDVKEARLSVFKGGTST